MKRVAITAMVCEPEGDLCYHSRNASTQMADPKNTEDQELSLDQLKDAAGGSRMINTTPPVLDDAPEPVSLHARTFPKDNIGGSAGPGGDDI